MKSTKKAAPATGRGRKMAVAGVAATGLAAGAAYLAYRRRRNDDHGMLDEETMLGIASAPPAGSSGAAQATPGVEVNAPEPMTESVAELAHGVNDPQ
ncbi:LPXTG cell wall anchor domain-containing protein [Hamadaea sp. NPDC051192]|uniref:LPXTG cell wall anchor domain-containing protein n=1 Tax=Hamadaea sp. NPDC051192 TaxID=3154940 RepID=UPI003420AC80